MDGEFLTFSTYKITPWLLSGTSAAGCGGIVLGIGSVCMRKPGNWEFTG